MTEQDIQNLIDIVLANATEFGFDVVAAIAVLLIGSWIAGRVKGLTAKALTKMPSMDETLVSALSGAAKYAVMALVLVVVLGQFGVETASIIAVLGAAGLAIGLSLQGTLSNVAAGLMILLLRPFKLGDFIEAGGTSGTVMGVGLFVLELKTPDGIYRVVPNSAVWSGAITNYSRHDTRRVDILASVSYDDDAPGAMALLEGLMKADARVLKDPEPVVFMANMAASSIDIQMRAWVQSEDYWQTLWDLTKTVKLELEAAGYSIPYPQQDLHIISQPGKSA